MDSNSRMRRVVSEVSWALTKFAESEHWQKSDFGIYYYENSEWDYVSFVFVSRQFDHEDERTSYLRVWRYLADYFKDDPELLGPVRLVVRGKAKVDRGGLDGIGSDYQEFWSFAPVPHSS